LCMSVQQCSAKGRNASLNLALSTKRTEYNDNSMLQPTFSTTVGMCCAICPARALPVFVWRRWFLRDGKPNAQFCFIQSCIACVMFIIESLKRVSAEWFHASLLLLASDAPAKRGQQLMFNFALDIAGRCCFVLALRATSSRVEPLFAYNFLFSSFLFFSLPFSCLCRMPPKFDPSAVSYV